MGLQLRGAEGKRHIQPLVRTGWVWPAGWNWQSADAKEQAARKRASLWPVLMAGESSLGAAVLTVSGRIFCSVFDAISGQGSALSRTRRDCADSRQLKASLLLGSGSAGLGCYQGRPVGQCLPWKTNGVRLPPKLRSDVMDRDKVTVPSLRARKQDGPKIAMVTAYDATFAQLFDRGGADILLVGDSLGMVVQGRANTLAVTLEEICYHGRAVARSVRRAHVVGDMPFMSFQVSAEKALIAAGTMMKSGAFEAVKLEGGRAVADQVRAIVRAGIPVMGHVGLLPQSVHAMGGFKVQGRGDEAANSVVEDAQALEDAGAYSIVLEGLPTKVAKRVTQSVQIPTIGIGAGPHCDGQVLVCYDLLGMYDGVRPRFVKRFAELGSAIVEATQDYVAEVASGVFPAKEHSFGSKVAAPATGAEAVVAEQAQSYGPADDEEA